MDKMKNWWHRNSLFCVLTLAVLLKIVVFQWTTFHSVPTLSLFTNPLSFLSFWLPKLAVAVFIGSFAYLSGKRWWSIVVVLILDAWIISNVIYYSANSLLLNGYAISIAGNLHGFESSVLMYLSSSVWVQVAITLAYIIALYKFVATNDEPRKVFFAVALLSSLLLSVLGGYALCRMYDNTGYIAMYQERQNPRAELIIPFYGDSFDANLFPTDYVRNHSIIMYLPIVAEQYVDILTSDESLNADVSFTSDEREYLNERLPSESKSVASRSCVLILVESLEDWAIHMKDDNGKAVAPNIQKMIGGANTLYCPKVKSQIQHGVSGDGQLIINTGLLPTVNAIACMEYGNNVYPNLASHYENSYVVNPSPGTWNQSVVTESYGYKQLIEPQAGMWSDDSVFVNMTQIVENTEYPFMLQALTINTHTPFQNSPKSLTFSKGTPTPLSNYLNCLHYTDSCFGFFMDYLEAANMLDSVTIVLTGDHTIFKRSLLGEFYPYVTNQGIEFYKDHTYCPLIIRSPLLEESTVYADECLQMDMFPTLLKVAGIEGYYWTGFGRNLLSPESDDGVSANFASTLSQKLIKTNWFANPVCHVNPDYGQHYIAHGGGRIGGHNYSNSKEAVLQSIDNGINFIELDLAMSSDGKLVYLHDWYGFNWMTTGEPREYVMSYEEYVKSKIFEQYTPITTEWLVQLYEEHPNLWLVTDKISTPEIIDQHFAKIKDRTLVECFSEADYLKLDSMGYKVMRSCWPPTKFAKLKHTLKENFGKHNDYPYNHYVCEVNANISSSKFDWVALYSVDTKAQADSIFAVNPKVHLVYVNSTGE
ncbi:MAG: sulfatase-like hydrolase/transferase [Paludibacteraceae bacterium]|nr:sulfatase-like hydrolase/transferase [Paludibacteraceae bacterium]